ncbi:DUF6479 family protein [Streptomyces daghestanicus]|jgi:hypothetical protein|uniref:Secreted protein n=1 Tax=Streptomyces daghestanicus TaxID=66885 RepID=A0ABQ3Q5Y4_9ACTN|nr:DUF6479 family protein [Streptomyces daghestanicus]GGU61122.1 hypothetical protein GCM10010259_59810 [Streptomyces daghestanicus]GHI32673.1 hypothetical protein Sdagh_44030 [Streptomyces daghestanicus]
MGTATTDLLAATQHTLNMTAAFLGGLVIAGALIWAVRVGLRVLDRDTGHPRPDEQPKMPATGPVREEREMREPDDVPVMAPGGSRLMPYELHRASTRRGKDQTRRRWLPGSTGSFGGGGLPRGL